MPAVPSGVLKALNLCFQNSLWLDCRTPGNPDTSTTGCPPFSCQKGLTMELYHGQGAQLREEGKAIKLQILVLSAPKYLSVLPLSPKHENSFESCNNCFVFL